MRTYSLLRMLGLAVGALAASGFAAAADDAVKIGLIAPMTGPFAPVGKQMQAGAKLYMEVHGDTAAGKKIELVVKDDAGVPDNSKRLARSSSSTITRACSWAWA